MQSELDLLHKKSTWELVHFPISKKVLPCKWLYKMKLTNNQRKPNYKARLVANGYKQQKGISFEEVIYPFVKR